MKETFNLKSLKLNQQISNNLNRIRTTKIDLFSNILLVLKNIYLALNYTLNFNRKKILCLFITKYNI